MWGFLRYKKTAVPFQKKKRLLIIILQATNGEVVRLRIVIAIDRSVGVIQVPSPRRGRTRSVDGRRPVVRVVATIVARASAGAVTTKGSSKRSHL